MARGQQSQPREPVASFFEGERQELRWRYAYRPEFVPLLMEYVGAQQGMHILEVGCGTGFLSRLLAQTLADVRVVGLEPNEKSLNLGHQLLERQKLTNVVLQHGAAYPMPFPDEAFDLVTSQTLL